MDNPVPAKPVSSPSAEKTIHIDDLDKPIAPGSPGAPVGGVSRAPLTLGGAAQAQAPRPVVPLPTAQKAAPPVSAGDRINGVRTFFTKLHPGALNFLDEQITAWLKQNPNIRIKSTNTTVGEIQEKKTEPNILITVWY
jgi:hypothetical protein